MVHRIQHKNFLASVAIVFYLMIVSATISCASLPFATPPRMPEMPMSQGGFDPSLLPPQDLQIYNQMTPQEKAEFGRAMEELSRMTPDEIAQMMEEEFKKMTPEQLAQLNEDLRTAYPDMFSPQPTPAPAQQPRPAPQPVQPTVKPTQQTASDSNVTSSTRTLARIIELLEHILNHCEQMQTTLYDATHDELMPIEFPELASAIRYLLTTIRIIQHADQRERLNMTSADVLYDSLVELETLLANHLHTQVCVPCLYRNDEQDPYVTLRVPYSASTEEIKKAFHTHYQRLQVERDAAHKQSQPEQEHIAALQLRILEEAYADIGDPQLRIQIDRARRENVELHLMAQEKLFQSLTTLSTSLTALMNQKLHKQLETFLAANQPGAAQKKATLEAAEQQRVQEQQQRQAIMPRPAYSDAPPVYGDPVVFPAWGGTTPGGARPPTAPPAPTPAPTQPLIPPIKPPEDGQKPRAPQPLPKPDKSDKKADELSKAAEAKKAADTQQKQAAQLRAGGQGAQQPTPEQLKATAPTAQPQLLRSSARESDAAMNALLTKSKTDLDGAANELFRHIGTAIAPLNTIITQTCQQTDTTGTPTCITDLQTAVKFSADQENQTNLISMWHDKLTASFVSRPASPASVTFAPQQPAAFSPEQFNTTLQQSITTLTAMLESTSEQQKIVRAWQQHHKIHFKTYAVATLLTQLMAAPSPNTNNPKHQILSAIVTPLAALQQLMGQVVEQPAAVVP